MGDQKKNVSYFESAPYMAFNFCSSVGIIFINKYLSQELGFSFATLLTSIHFAITFLGMKVCAYLGIFEPKPVPFKEVVPLALSFCGFVVFNNLSIVYNSLSFYQIAKVMTTPVIAVIQYHIFGVATHRKLIGALSLICAGVIISLMSDVAINMTGTIYATCGVLSTSMYQIWVKSKQKDLGVNSFQLLLYQAPVAAVMVLFFVPVFDHFNDYVSEDGVAHLGLYSFVWTAELVRWILLSAVAAFCVNLSIFLVIGKSSPISYNVLGHCKLMMILTGGYLFFGDEMNDRKLFGIAFAFGGILIYSYLKFTIADGWESYKGKAGSKPEDSEAQDGAEKEGLLEAQVDTPNADVKDTKRNQLS